MLLSFITTIKARAGTLTLKSNRQYGIIVKFVKNKIMGTAELRKKLHSYIDTADDKFLKMVHALAKNYEEDLEKEMTEW